MINWLLVETLVSVGKRGKDTQRRRIILSALHLQVLLIVQAFVFFMYTLFVLINVMPMLQCVNVSKCVSSIRMWSGSQRDAHEPQSHHSPPDVWSTGCGHKWLDWRHLLHTLEENSERKERSERFLKLLSDRHWTGNLWEWKCPKLVAADYSSSPPRKNWIMSECESTAGDYLEGFLSNVSSTLSGAFGDKNWCWSQWILNKNMWSPQWNYYVPHRRLLQAAPSLVQTLWRFMFCC